MRRLLSGLGEARGEHPLRAQSWGLPEMKDMVRQCGGQRFTLHGCMHGLVSHESKKPCLKPWGWFSSLPSVREALQKSCSHHPSKAAAIATYPYLLCRRFAKALMAELRRYRKEVESCRVPQRVSAAEGKEDAVENFDGRSIRGRSGLSQDSG